VTERMNIDVDISGADKIVGFKSHYQLALDQPGVNNLPSMPLKLFGCLLQSVSIFLSVACCPGVKTAQHGGLWSHEP